MIFAFVCVRPVVVTLLLDFQRAHAARSMSLGAYITHILLSFFIRDYDVSTRSLAFFRMHYHATMLPRSQ